MAVLLPHARKEGSSLDPALRIVVVQSGSSAAMHAIICHCLRSCASSVIPPEYVSPIRGALLRGASHEPKDVFSRALFPNARGALVSEGVLHVGAMGVALCRAGGNPVLAPCLGDVDDQVKPTQRA